MRVLGADPGLRRFGYAVVEAVQGEVRVLEADVVETPETQPLEQRVLRLFELLEEVIAQARPEEVAYERYFGKSPTSEAFGVGCASGALLTASARAGLPCHGYSAAEVKKGLTGYGMASKEQIRRTVEMLTGHTVACPSPDCSDAVAVALVHALSPLRAFGSKGAALR